MERTQVYLTEEQKEALKRMSDEQDTSVADLIREAIDRQLRAPDLSSVRDALHESFGAWKARSDSAERTARSLREEWHDREHEMSDDS